MRRLPNPGDRLVASRKASPPFRAFTRGPGVAGGRPALAQSLLARHLAGNQGSAASALRRLLTWCSTPGSRQERRHQRQACGSVWPAAYAPEAARELPAARFLADETFAIPEIGLSLGPQPLAGGGGSDYPGDLPSTTARRSLGFRRALRRAAYRHQPRRQALDEATDLLGRELAPGWHAL